MKNKILFTCFALLFAACEGPPSETSAKPGDEFYMSAPSFLYFKNMRSIKYEETPASNTNKVVYQFKQWEEVKDRPQLIPQIICNILKDEAYLMLAQNDYENGISKPLQIRRVGEEESIINEVGSATQSGIQYQTAFAIAIANAMSKNELLEIKDNQGEWQPIFQNEDDRQYYLITLQDYLRLTED